MFKWLKQLLQKASPPKKTENPAQVATPQPLKRLNRGEIAGRYLSTAPGKSISDVSAFIAAGGAEAASPLEMNSAREKIVRLGYQDPINSTLRNELNDLELLAFLRWHVQEQIDREAYRDENTIHALIQQFRDSVG